MSYAKSCASKTKVIMFEKGNELIGIVSEVRINLCKRHKTGKFYNCNSTCIREETSCRKVVDVYKDQVIVKPLFRINVIVIYLLNPGLPSTYG